MMSRTLRRRETFCNLRQARVAISFGAAKPPQHTFTRIARTNSISSRSLRRREASATASEPVVIFESPRSLRNQSLTGSEWWRALQGGAQPPQRWPLVGTSSRDLQGAARPLQRPSAPHDLQGATKPLQHRPIGDVEEGVTGVVAISSAPRSLQPSARSMRAMSRDLFGAAKPPQRSGAQARRRRDLLGAAKPPQLCNRVQARLSHAVAISSAPRSREASTNRRLAVAISSAPRSHNGTPPVRGMWYVAIGFASRSHRRRAASAIRTCC